MSLEIVQPKISMLSTEQKNIIHKTALQILADVGIRFDSERAVEILKTTDGISVDEKNIAKFSPEIVEWAIEQAPSVVEMYSRTGELAFRLGDDRTRFGIGVTSLYYQEPDTSDLVTFGRPHMTNMVRLGDQLPNYDVISTVGVIQDYPPKTADMYAVLEMTANTTKPLVLLISDELLFAPALDMLEQLHGHLSEKPYILPYLNPVSPLVVNEDTIAKMITAAERGIPFIYNTYGMAGASTPITPAGVLGLMNAELLAGLVFTQLIKAGSPIVLGMLPAYFDMRMMVNFYDAKSYLISLACAEMMKHYGLPHSGTSGSGNGWMGDLIDFENYWFNHLVLTGNAGLAPFVGDTLRSKVFSPINAVYANEIIEKVLKFHQGFRLDEENLGFSEIVEEGIGGHFLTSPLTLKNYKNAYTISDIFPQHSMEAWQEAGKPNPHNLLIDYTQNMLSNLKEPEDYQDLISRGEAFIKRL